MGPVWGIPEQKGPDSTERGPQEATFTWHLVVALQYLREGSGKMGLRETFRDMDTQHSVEDAAKHSLCSQRDLAGTEHGSLQRVDAICR